MNFELHIYWWRLSIFVRPKFSILFLLINSIVQIILSTSVSKENKEKKPNFAQNCDILERISFISTQTKQSRALTIKYKCKRYTVHVYVERRKEGKKSVNSIINNWYLHKMHVAGIMLMGAGARACSIQYTYTVLRFAPRVKLDIMFSFKHFFFQQQNTIPIQNNRF